MPVILGLTSLSGDHMHFPFSILSKSDEFLWMCYSCQGIHNLFFFHPFLHLLTHYEQINKVIGEISKQILIKLRFESVNENVGQPTISQWMFNLCSLFLPPLCIIFKGFGTLFLHVLEVILSWSILIVPILFMKESTKSF